MMGPSLETGTVFDAALSGELLRDCDSVSVIAVQEKCDEQGGSCGSENPMRETAGIPPFSQSARKRTGHPAEVKWPQATKGKGAPESECECALVKVRS
jgi:hypothetical protein